VIWVWVVVAVLVVGVAAVLIAGRDDEMAEVYDDRPDVPLPAGRPLTAADLDGLRFSTGLRGYRMDEVDAFIARVKADLISREAHEARPHELGEHTGVSRDAEADPVTEGEPVAGRNSVTEGEPVAGRNSVTEGEPVAEGDRGEQGAEAQPDLRSPRSEPPAPAETDAEHERSERA
jgi:DivIVA domain-containing protein